MAHQGLLFEPEIGLYDGRRRKLIAPARRFLQRDELNYVDGLNLYGAMRQNPLNVLDPLGNAGVTIDLTAPDRIRVWARIAFWGCGLTGNCDNSCSTPVVPGLNFMWTLGPWSGVQHPLVVSFRQACAIAIEDTAATQAADLTGISGNQLRAAIGGGAAGVSLSF